MLIVNLSIIINSYYVHSNSNGYSVFKIKKIISQLINFSICSFCHSLSLLQWYSLETLLPLTTLNSTYNFQIVYLLHPFFLFLFVSFPPMTNCFCNNRITCDIIVFEVKNKKRHYIFIYVTMMLPLQLYNGVCFDDFWMMSTKLLITCL